MMDFIGLLIYVLIFMGLGILCWRLMNYLAKCIEKIIHKLKYN